MSIAQHARYHSNNTVCAFIFVVAVAVLSPTNPYVLLLYTVPEIHSTCPSTYATDSTESGDYHDTRASHPSHETQNDEKQPKNCAQKHMDVPGCAVR